MTGLGVAVRSAVSTARTQWMSASETTGASSAISARSGRPWSFRSTVASWSATGTTRTISGVASGRPLAATAR